MMYFIRRLNKPYKRSDFVIGGFCKIIDGVVDIISLGYFRSDLHMSWTQRNLNSFLSYFEDKK